jgi:secreted PhoX family phosphatase
MGDNHDGMVFFPLPGKENDGLLVLNHEYVSHDYFFAGEPGQRDAFGDWTADKVRKSQHAHGVAILRVRLGADGRWEHDSDSPLNRRIHARTTMQISGPAAGHALLRTAADPCGRSVRGTFSNCGCGTTPWGTYLTCEENFDGYFGSGTSAEPTPLQRRYGITRSRSAYRWEFHDERFDWSRHPNEAHRHGWVVEIDPFDPTSTPVKRTALGRFKHETANHVLAPDGRIVIYMGDDEQNEYIYKFVSHGRYDPTRRKANGALLDAGDLYVARFDDGAVSGDGRGSGCWLLLDKQRNPVLAAATELPDQANVLIHARRAADLVGATPMDRPEWLAIDPITRMVYATLTNNSARMKVDDANPRAPNPFGQIIRWREAGDDPAALSFEWDHYVLAGQPKHADPALRGSTNLTADNQFNSPDALYFDAAGRLWICTDGDVSDRGLFQGQGNNQLLLGDPVSGRISRFLVGPSGCELTGVTLSPDLRTLFVNVQHPGAMVDHPRLRNLPSRKQRGAWLAQNPLAFSQWPDAAGGRPRAATVIVRRADGGVIGS